MKTMKGTPFFMLAMQRLTRDPKVAILYFDKNVIFGPVNKAKEP